MKDIRKALKMRYVANLSLRDISNATKLPHTTISDYCKRFDSSGYKLDELLSLSDDKISLTLFKDKQIVKKLPIKELPDVVYIHKEIAKKVLPLNCYGKSIKMLIQMVMDYHNLKSITIDIRID